MQIRVSAIQTIIVVELQQLLHRPMIILASVVAANALLLADLDLRSDECFFAECFSIRWRDPSLQLSVKAKNMFMMSIISCVNWAKQQTHASSWTELCVQP